MMKIKPTRMELLKIKKRLAFATKGHKLLKDKHDALIMDFFNQVSNLRKLRVQVSKDLSEVYSMLGQARAFQGADDVASLSLSLAGGLEYNLKKKSLKGAKIVEITDVKTSDKWFSYFRGSLPFTQAVVKARSLADKFFKMVELQVAIRNLADEIKKVKRRVNSLEYIIIPDLETNCDRISERLEELQRENFIRLKKVKEYMEKQEGIV